MKHYYTNFSTLLNALKIPGKIVRMWDEPEVVDSYVHLMVEDGEVNPLEMSPHQYLEAQSVPPLVGRYMVFAGDGFYPSGGFNDYRFSRDDLDEAVEAARAYIADGNTISESESWFHVVDSWTFEKVASG